MPVFAKLGYRLRGLPPPRPSPLSPDCSSEASDVFLKLSTHGAGFDSRLGYDVLEYGQKLMTNRLSEASQEISCSGSQKSEWDLQIFMSRALGVGVGGARRPPGLRIGGPNLEFAQFLGPNTRV